MADLVLYAPHLDIALTRMLRGDTLGAIGDVRRVPFGNVPGLVWQSPDNQTAWFITVFDVPAIRLYFVDFSVGSVSNPLTVTSDLVFMGIDSAGSHYYAAGAAGGGGTWLYEYSLVSGLETRSWEVSFAGSVGFSRFIPTSNTFVTMDTGGQRLVHVDLVSGSLTSTDVSSFPAEFFTGSAPIETGSVGRYVGLVSSTIGSIDGFIAVVDTLASIILWTETFPTGTATGAVALYMSSAEDALFYGNSSLFPSAGPVEGLHPIDITTGTHLTWSGDTSVVFCPSYSISGPNGLVVGEGSSPTSLCLPSPAGGYLVAAQLVDIGSFQLCQVSDDGSISIVIPPAEFSGDLVPSSDGLSLYAITLPADNTAVSLYDATTLELLAESVAGPTEGFFVDLLFLAPQFRGVPFLRFRQRDDVRGVKQKKAYRTKSKQYSVRQGNHNTYT